MARRERVEKGIYRRTAADGRTRFEIGWRDAENKQRWKVVDGGIKAARHALAEAHAQRGRGEKVAADPRLRFDTAADAWWEARVVRMRPTTQNAYGANLTHLRRHFGQWRMADISVSDVATFITAQQRAGLKGWTIKGQINNLSAIFNFAARHLGLAGVNPVSLLDRVERPSSDDEKPKRILNGDELRRLLAAI